MQLCCVCGFAQNRDGALYCSNCAAPLAAPAPAMCPRCGMQNSLGARFCSNCAASLTSRPLTPAMTGLLAPNALLQSRYVILRKVGQGGMGAVYQAQDAHLAGKQWAVKEMSDAQLADPAERANAVASFQQEAQLLAGLDHPNLPQVADYFAEGGKQYLVMDFVDGQTLEQIVAAAPGFLPEPTVLTWIEQVCDVLEYLHARQPPIVFRDLKCANIMLTREGMIKLIDFGIARLFKAGKTKDTAAYGTMGFAAPEQFGTGQTDARSDIYSLGVTLHNLLTKYDPSISPFNLPPARNINPLISTQTDAVIVCATAASGAQRFQSAREMKQALREKVAVPMPTQTLSTRPTSPVQISYVFAPGKVANTTQELVRICEKDWERAVTQFYEGYFEKWLIEIAEFGLASRAKHIVEQDTDNPPERNRGLHDWLEQTGLCKLRPTMVLIPAGEFIMGAKDHGDDAKRPHKVYLDEFQIGKFPVTNVEYGKFVSATRHGLPSHWRNGQIPQGEENHPVVLVTWDDANEYAQWLGWQLPTEAEWEKAASWDDKLRAKRLYPWGDQFDPTRCNTSESSQGTSSVGKYSPKGDSPYGVADMAGNVWEWCADWYKPDYYRISPRDNPEGPEFGHECVLRGGSWADDRELARSAFRESDSPAGCSEDIGFRVAVSISRLSPRPS